MPTEPSAPQPEINLQAQPDARQYAPATQRNREPILAVLQQILPAGGTVLEIASGTGEHATFFAPQLPHLRWQPSETNALSINSIQAWASALPAPNLLAPLLLNVNNSPWNALSQQAKKEITAIVNINMIHISPWESCQQLMAGAERILTRGDVLYLYGPYKRNGEHTAPSNEAFDAVLQSRHPQWGIRDLEAVCSLAEQHHLKLSQVIPMPANNFSVVFHRQ